MNFLSGIWKNIRMTIINKYVGVAALVVFFTLAGMVGINANTLTLASREYVDTKVQETESRLDNKIDCSTASIKRTILIEKLLDLEQRNEDTTTVKEYRRLLNDDLSKSERVLKGCD